MKNHFKKQNTICFSMKKHSLYNLFWIQNLEKKNCFLNFLNPYKKQFIQKTIWNQKFYRNHNQNVNLPQIPFVFVRNVNLFQKSVRSTWEKNTINTKKNTFSTWINQYKPNDNIVDSIFHFSRTLNYTS